MAAYRLANGGVVREADGAFVPEATGNLDWLRYEVWRADGGVPDEAQAAPQPSAAQQLGLRDYQMARDHESLIAVLVSKGLIRTEDLDPTGLANVNARRTLRGLGPIS